MLKESCNGLWTKKIDNPLASCTIASSFPPYYRKGNLMPSPAINSFARLLASLAATM